MLSAHHQWTEEFSNKNKNNKKTSKATDKSSPTEVDNCSFRKNKGSILTRLVAERLTSPTLPDLYVWVPAWRRIVFLNKKLQSTFSHFTRVTT